MTIALTSPHFERPSTSSIRSAHEVVAETIGHGIDKIFDVHWDCTNFMAEFAGGRFKQLGTIQLLNEMMNNWIDAKSEALNALPAKDRAAMELASWAWKPFFEFASTLEE